MELGIKDKVAIVTGASSPKGIGNAVARALAAEGVHVALPDIAMEGVEALADEIKNMGLKAMAIQADQGDFDQVKKAVDTVQGEFGRVDILVNCAALMGNFGTITKMAPEKWAREINVSLNGPYHWTREVFPIMKGHNWGRIVNISSVAGLFGTTGLPSYAVCKGGLHTFTKQTAREGANKGILANCVVLGIILTEVYERAGMSPEVVEKLTKGIPLGRMGQPDEIAAMVTYLCSEKNSYTTGAVIPMDGALTLSI